MSTLRVAIAGATGYAGEELIRLLLQHPQVQLSYLAASAKWERPSPASTVYPQFANQLDLPIEPLDPSRLAACDVAFLALPHGTAMDLVPALLEAGKRVIDLSGDFRLRDPADYPKWYQFRHAHPELLSGQGLAYGLTEFNREAIQAARLVANPGCYATSILLGSLPLFQATLIGDNRFIVDAKSGFTGAGRKGDSQPAADEFAENLRAYKVNEHQHMPEVLQEIARVAGEKPLMAFVPQVIPVARGLVSTIYLRIRASLDQIQEAYRTSYPDGTTPFVRVRPRSWPQLKDVAKTNYCDIGFTYDPKLETLIVSSALDNLTKGAAGQAIQNFNLMHGFPETTALN